LLYQTVGEDSRCVTGEHEASNETGRSPEQVVHRVAEKYAGAGTDGRLADANHDQTAVDRIDRAQEVRVERSLIEDIATDPVAAGDLLRPGVVGSRVSKQDVEEGRVAHRPQMGDAHS